MEFEQKLWKISCLVKQNECRDSEKYAPVEQNEAILDFLRDQRVGKVDCFVYGDTNKASIYRRDGGPLAINAGSLTCERRNGNSEELPDTYIVIDKDCVAVRQMGRQEPLFERDYN